MTIDPEAFEPQKLEMVEDPIAFMAPKNEVADPDSEDEDSDDDEEDEDPRQGLPPTVQVEVANEIFHEAPPITGAKGPWIQYTGVALIRIMTPKDWATVGVRSTKHCEWNSRNKKKLPRSMFTDEELQYLLRRDGRFALVDK